jgi:hypothetical protein
MRKVNGIADKVTDTSTCVAFNHKRKENLLKVRKVSAPSFKFLLPFGLVEDYFELF